VLLLRIFEKRRNVFVKNPPTTGYSGLKLQHPDWDHDFDHEIIELLQVWYLLNVPDDATTLDWDSLFTAEIFRAFTVVTAPTLVAATTGSTTPAAAAAAASAAAAAAAASASSSMIPPHGYSHDYHNEVLIADDAALLRRAGTSPSLILTPHPLWTSHTMTGAVKIDTKNFLGTSLDPLVTSDATAVKAWYRVLNHQATAASIDLCPLESFKKKHALWPKNLPAPIVFEMSSALLLKLQAAAVLDHTKDPIIQLLFQQHIATSSSKLSAYYFLHALLAFAFDTTAGQILLPPKYTDSMDVTTFAFQLLNFRQEEQLNSRAYSDREMSLRFLRELDSNGVEVRVELKALEDLPLATQPPDSLLYTNLAVNLQSRLAITAPSNTHGVAHRLQQQRPSDRTPPHASTPRGAGRAGKPSAPPRDNPFRQSADVQCQACGLWGHAANTCSGLAKAACIAQYMADQPANTATAASGWRDVHSVKNRTNLAHTLFMLGQDDFVMHDLSDTYCADFP
jgi:hypothetical protein